MCNNIDHNYLGHDYFGRTHIRMQSHKQTRTHALIQLVSQNILVKLVGYGLYTLIASLAKARMVYLPNP